ncbi:MAG: recombinase [Methanobacteriota archaeon]|nr:MAG: recombinase [Euryarchaeota archaeon]
MKLLLHICCAPCSTEVIERLKGDYDVTGFFYNPNIHPRREYGFRLKELERFSKKAGFPFITGDYDLKRWFRLVRGLEKEPEGGRRCEVCFRMRLEETAREAAAAGFDVFTTTLTISPHKDAETINSIGRELEEEYGVRFLVADFKKKDGFKRSVEHSRRHGLRRQDYCGCVYSRLERRRQAGRVR